MLGHQEDQLAALERDDLSPEALHAVGERDGGLHPFTVEAHDDLHLGVRRAVVGRAHQRGPAAHEREPDGDALDARGDERGRRRPAAGGRAPDASGGRRGEIIVRDDLQDGQQAAVAEREDQATLRRIRERRRAGKLGPGATEIVGPPDPGAVGREDPLADDQRARAVVARLPEARRGRGRGRARDEVELGGCPLAEHDQLVANDQGRGKRGRVDRRGEQGDGGGLLEPAGGEQGEEEHGANIAKGEVQGCLGSAAVARGSALRRRAEYVR
jgi:hypothetical protein